MVIYPKLLKNNYAYVLEVESYLLNILASTLNSRVVEVTTGPDSRYDGKLQTYSGKLFTVEVKVSSTQNIFIEERRYRFDGSGEYRYIPAGIYHSKADYYLILSSLPKNMRQRTSKGFLTIAATKDVKLALHSNRESIPTKLRTFKQGYTYKQGIMLDWRTIPVVYCVPVHVVTHDSYRGVGYQIHIN